MHMVHVGDRWHLNHDFWLQHPTPFCVGDLVWRRFYLPRSCGESDFMFPFLVLSIVGSTRFSSGWSASVYNFSRECTEDYHCSGLRLAGEET